MPQHTVEEDLRGFEHAKSLRSNFETYWQDTADYVLPIRSFTVKYHPGQKRNLRIYNTAAIVANEAWAAVMDGMLTNTSIAWLSYGTDDNAERADRESRDWLYLASRLGLNYLQSSVSGFPQATHELYLDLGAFGTGIIQSNETKQGMLRFKARSLTSHYMYENDEDEIVDRYRIFEPTARELRVMFPEGKFSRDVLEKAKDPKRCEEKVEVIHRVYRRDQYEGAETGARKSNKPWGSRYIEVKTKTLIHEGGFDEDPFMSPRWSKASGEVYGRGIAMSILSMIHVVNAKEKTYLIAAEKAVNPPLNIPANGMEGPVRTAPGSFNYVKSGVTQLPQPLQHGANLQLARADIEHDEQAIREAYMLDAMELPQPGVQQRMTAEEIATRRQQGLIRMSPNLNRLYAELLNPVAMRTLAWLEKTGKLPQRPEPLRRGNIKVFYQSPAALSQRASESDNFIGAFRTAGPLITADPSVMDNIDTDKAIRRIFAMFNTDPDFIRREVDVRRNRQARAEQDQIAQTAAIAEQGAGAFKDAAKGARDLGLTNGAMP